MRAAIAAVNPAKPAAASGLIHGAIEGEEDEGGEDEDHEVGADLEPSDQPKGSKPTGT